MVPNTFNQSYVFIPRVWYLILYAQDSNIYRGYPLWYLNIILIFFTEYFLMISDTYGV